MALIFTFIVIFITTFSIYYLYINKNLKVSNVENIVNSSDPREAYMVINNLNMKIKHIRDEQNVNYHLTSATNSPVKAAALLQKLISESHDQILNEVQSLMSKGYSGYPMANMDKTQNSLTNGDKSWSPIWIKFIDTWAGTSKLLPTLTNIVKTVGDDILLLHVSVFNPRTVLKLHKGISMGVWRYHYGLSIPDGDLGLMVNNVNYRWKNGEGIIWDDTLLHKAWNNTDEFRLVIFADIFRDGPNKSDVMKAHMKIKEIDDIKRISKVLSNEGKFLYKMNNS